MFNFYPRRLLLAAVFGFASVLAPVALASLDSDIKDGLYIEAEGLFNGEFEFESKFGDVENLVATSCKPALGPGSSGMHATVVIKFQAKDGRPFGGDMQITMPKGTRDGTYEPVLRSTKEKMGVVITLIDGNGNREVFDPTGGKLGVEPFEKKGYFVEFDLEGTMGGKKQKLEGEFRVSRGGPIC